MEQRTRDNKGEFSVNSTPSGLHNHDSKAKKNEILGKQMTRQLGNTTEPRNTLQLNKPGGNPASRQTQKAAINGETYIMNFKAIVS